VHRCLTATITALAALALAAPAHACNSTIQPSSENVGKVKGGVLCEVNRVRAARGLARFRAQRQLTRAARRHSLDMVSLGYFSHTSVDGRSMTDRVAATGYLPRRGSWTLGENLAWGTGSYAMPASVVRSWMESPGHRAIRLSSRYRDAGVGVAIGTPERHDGATITLNVGRRTDATAARKRRP
jgi:uncharacterized protein YkwD